MSDDSQIQATVPRERILDFERFLPFGETLRGYLEQPFVKSIDLSELLRARGVFLQGAQKDDLIPILTATLISPSEFQTLLECRKERDSKEKTVERNRIWKSKRTLLDATNAAVQLDKINFDSTEKCKLLGRPTISTIKGDPESVELNFTVLRTKISLDWSNERSQFNGKITLKKVNVGNRVVLTLTYTSPETKEVAEKFSKLIEDSLRNSNDIGEPSVDDQILYSSFNNVQRADFLLSLTGECKHQELKFVHLSNLEALTDRTKPIPESCKELIQGFEQIRLRGELHNSAYCNKREIYPFVRFYRMDARFKFKVFGAEGECSIRYEFAEYSTFQDKDAEFAYEIDISHLDEKFKNISKSSVKKPLQELVSRVVGEKFKKRNDVNPSTNPPIVKSKSKKSPPLKTSIRSKMPQLTSLNPELPFPTVS